MGVEVVHGGRTAGIVPWGRFNHDAAKQLGHGKPETAPVVRWPRPALLVAGSTWKSSGRWPAIEPSLAIKRAARVSLASGTSRRPRGRPLAGLVTRSLGQLRDGGGDADDGPVPEP
ncbi:hypothetical protein GCM10020220_054880 [Nonomuraea rubra]